MSTFDIQSIQCRHVLHVGAVKKYVIKQDSVLHTLEYENHTHIIA